MTNSTTAAARIGRNHCRGGVGAGSGQAGPTDRGGAANRSTNRGPVTTTLSQVAAAAEVPVGNIYYYFKTKDELVSAVITAYDRDFATLDAILSQQVDTPGAAEIADSYLDRGP